MLAATWAQIGLRATLAPHADAREADLGIAASLATASWLGWSGGGLAAQMPLYDTLARAPATLIWRATSKFRYTRPESPFSFVLRRKFPRLAIE